MQPLKMDEILVQSIHKKTREHEEKIKKLEKRLESKDGDGHSESIQSMVDNYLEETEIHGLKRAFHGSGYIRLVNLIILVGVTVTMGYMCTERVLYH